MLMNWLMDKSEKFLTAYQKSNAISLSTESDSNSDDPAYTKIPDMLSNAKTKQKHIVIINKFFTEYLKEQHTGKDVNLLNGVISSKDHNNNQHIVSNLFQETDKNLEESKDNLLEKQGQKLVSPQFESNKNKLNKNYLSSEINSPRANDEINIDLGSQTRNIHSNIYNKDEHDQSAQRIAHYFGASLKF